MLTSLYNNEYIAAAIGTDIIISTALQDRIVQRTAIQIKFYMENSNFETHFFYKKIGPSYSIEKANV